MILLLLIIAQGDDDHGGNDLELAIDDGIKITEMVYCNNRSMNIEEHPFEFNDAVETLHKRNLSELDEDMHVQKAEQGHREGPSTKLNSAEFHRLYCNI